MGCLKNIIKFIILVFAIIGFISVGGTKIFQGKFDFNIFEKPSQEKLKEQASAIANLSDISDEYKIDNVTKVLGFKSVIASHQGTKQKMLIIDTGKKELLSPDDFKNKEIDKKIENLAEKIQYQFIRVENVKIVQNGTIQTMNSSAPYVKFKADTVNLPIPEIQGIVGLSTDKNGQNKLILSINDSNKYSQIITQEFFRHVQ